MFKGGEGKLELKVGNSGSGGHRFQSHYGNHFSFSSKFGLYVENFNPDCAMILQTGGLRHGWLLIGFRMKLKLVPQNKNNNLKYKKNTSCASPLDKRSGKFRVV